MRRGGRVAGTVRNLAHADQLKKQFPDQLWIGALDLSDLANIANTFHAAVEPFGRVHAAVSNTVYNLLGAAESPTIRLSTSTIWRFTSSWRLSTQLPNRP